MKKIINGMRYDTATATEVGYWENTPNTGNFDCTQETLYLTKRGSWFIHGEGHARSPYASHQGNMSGWGEDIVPLTPEAALAWLERRGRPEAIEVHFGQKVSDV